MGEAGRGSSGGEGVIRRAPQDEARERPPVPWNRLVMEAKEAAAFLKMSETEFRRLAAKGTIPRHRTTGGRYRYYAYELLDWLLQR